MKIKTTGREDLQNFLDKSGYFKMSVLKHYPLIVFVERNQIIEVEIINSFEELINSAYPDETKVMSQWGGQWSSNFFKYTIGEVREYAKNYKEDDE